MGREGRGGGRFDCIEGLVLGQGRRCSAWEDLKDEGWVVEARPIPQEDGSLYDSVSCHISKLAKV